MTEPERDILSRVLERLGKLRLSVDVDLAGLGDAPDDFASFERMDPRRQSAARAFLKSFEQTEDQLSRAFRIIPKLMGEDARRWFARDYADFMERFGVLDEAAAWSAVVRLRNELVHDYPLDPQVQLDRLLMAIELLPLLRETIERLASFVRTELPGKIL